MNLLFLSLINFCVTRITVTAITIPKDKNNKFINYLSLPKVFKRITPTTINPIPSIPYIFGVC